MLPRHQQARHGLQKDGEGEAKEEEGDGSSEELKPCCKRPGKNHTMLSSQECLHVTRAMPNTSTVHIAMTRVYFQSNGAYIIINNTDMYVL